MCGIAGVVSLGRPIADRTGVARLLSDALAHRGPDGGGVWSPASMSAADVLLVHRRLAIIDPGPDGAQPMATPDGRHHIVFNGEVYNYRELRRDLEARGERFFTQSDTEVLLRLLARDGAPSLARVRGMFALACWDDAERSLLLARDRFGIKPLYVASGGPDAAGARQIAFASELTALQAARLLDGEPSPAGVLGFLSWGSVIPPLTWQRGVEMLAPGSWRRWRDGAFDSGVFADARDAYRSASTGARTSERDYRAAVGEAVRDSVRAHLVADVPVGVFLSGGLDSGAIVSAATSAGATNLQTFTVGFDDASSEADAARMVATHFGARHHELRVDASHVAADFPKILARLDQPTIDAVNSYYVAKAVAATGIKAVLSGTGGDEMFGGYASFTRIPRAMSAKRACGPLWPLVAPIAGAFMPPRLQARWRHFAAADGSVVDSYRVQRGFLLPEELDDLAGPALRDAGVWRDAHGELDAAEHALLDPSGAEAPSASIARLESRLFLESQLLRDIDVMAMAHGLEVRVPFVDHELLGAVWPELGWRPALLRHKRLLYSTLERPLPDAIVRRPKQGFTLPFGRWIGGELAPVVRDGLARLADRRWIAPDAPARVWTAWVSGRVHWSRPWGLAVLGHFLDGARA
ncbi:MAG: asparagine synthase (glutamine-hydrolyzing) [Acidobacteriia bacterium]|nr:asparagine synthase (glutamine-hydrolyzing) [Terriglobia bacterium]